MFRGIWLIFSLLALSLIMSPGAYSPAMAGQHCGAQGDWRSNLVPDYWPPKGVKTSWVPGGSTIKQVPVYKACIRHDECYDRPGSTQAECDRQFLEDMCDQCGRVYGDFLQLAHLEACKIAAQGYYQAVAKYGGPAFARAQAKAAQDPGTGGIQTAVGQKVQTQSKNSAAGPSGADKPANGKAAFNLPTQNQGPKSAPAKDSSFSLSGKEQGSTPATTQGQDNSPFALPAESQAKQPIQPQPPASQALLDKGVALTKQGKLDQARNVFFAAVKQDPTNAVAWNNLGLTLRHQGQLKQAAQAYEKAIKADPSYAVPYKNLGVLLEKAGERAKAAKAYRRYAELAPQAPDAASVSKRAAWLESTLKK